MKGASRGQIVSVIMNHTDGHEEGTYKFKGCVFDPGTFPLVAFRLIFVDQLALLLVASCQKFCECFCVYSVNVYWNRVKSNANVHP